MGDVETIYVSAEEHEELQSRYDNLLAELLQADELALQLREECERLGDELARKSFHIKELEDALEKARSS